VERSLALYQAAGIEIVLDGEKRVVIFAKLHFFYVNSQQRLDKS